MDIESQIKFVFMLGSIVGFTVILATSVTVLPLSYIMNKYIHHNVAIRWFLGIFGTVFGVFVIVYALVMAILFNKQVYYFGLFPSYIPATVQAGGGEGEGEVGSWLTRIYELIRQLSSPFSIVADLFAIENFTDQGSNVYAAFREHIKQVYEGDIRIPKFDVDLMEKVKDAGKETTLGAWSSAMENLEEDCGALFAPISDFGDQRSDFGDQRSEITPV